MIDKISYSQGYKLAGDWQRLPPDIGCCRYISVTCAERDITAADTAETVTVRHYLTRSPAVARMSDRTAPVVKLSYLRELVWQPSWELDYCPDWLNCG